MNRRHPFSSRLAHALRDRAKAVFYNFSSAMFICMDSNTAGFFNEIFATHPDSKIIQTALLLVLAITIILSDGAFLYRKATDFIELS